jgi:alpha-tubulin suppressor-like RCC1 family protein
MRPKITALVALAVLAVVGWANPSNAEALTGVTSVTTGYYHGCAALANGQARCWGWATDGQLGNGSTDAEYSAAVTVRSPSGNGPLTGVRAVASGDDHSCALLTNTQVRCWGANDYGQLGDGGDELQALPVAVRNVAGTGNLTSVVQISAAGETTCAVLRNSQVRCWGDNGYGQLGNEDAGSWAETPVPVYDVSLLGALTGVTQVDVGNSATCARLANGQARCWGDNDYGELGDGTDDPRERPVVVRNARNTGPLVNVRRISVGFYHTCATITDGSVRCWGYNDYGEVGDGSDDTRLLPVVVRNAGNTGPLRGISYVDAGAYHTCALRTDGGARCWGEADYGELGNGQLTPDRGLPVTVRNAGDNGNLAGVTQLQATDYHTCVRLQNGQARCWGYGSYGGLGNGDDSDSALPVKVLRAT